MRTEDLSWLAGFIEGEGSFTFNSVLLLRAGQVQRWPLEQCQRLCGGRIHPKKANNERSSPGWTWYISGVKAAAMMRLLDPLMSPRRQHQLRTALGAWMYQRTAGRVRRDLCSRGHEISGEGKGRQCRTCKKNAIRDWRVRKRLRVV